MDKIRKGLLGSILVLTLLITMVTPALAQQATKAVVQIAPSDLTMARGGVVEVAVEIREVSGLYGFDLLVQYDPQVLEVVDMDASVPGIQAAQGMFLDPGLIAMNSVDAQTGEIRYVMTQINPSEAKSGSGVLVVVKFRAVKAGSTSNIEIKQALLSSPMGGAIDAELTPGAIHVAGEATPVVEPTPTEIPVQDGGEYIPTEAPTPEGEVYVTPQVPITALELSTETPTGETDEPYGSPAIEESTAIAHSTQPGQTAAAVGTENPADSSSAAGESPWYWIGGIGLGLIGLAGLVIGLRQKKA